MSVVKKVDESPTMEAESSISFNSIPDVEKYSENIILSVFGAIQASRNLPSSGDKFDFYNSFRGFRTFMNAEGETILKLISRILKREGTKGNFESLDQEDQIDFLIDINDSILERISNACDEASGLKKKEEDLVLASISSDAKIITTSWNKKNAQIMKNDAIKLLTARNIIRPQLKFKDKIDNTHSPFVSIIKDKPNSLKPLAIILETTSYGEEYSHPYEVEIEKFAPGKELLCFQHLPRPEPVEQTDFKFVDKIEDLQSLVSDLKRADSVAVDLEAHSYRSFMGFTCLIQISTVDKDYIIDSLELRSELHVLNECFTNPKIVKVFHGADSDVEWLQRDFGVYVVNLFDTYHASALLNFSRRSLAFLLLHYCNIQANKQYQLADWRIRPLPVEMIKYAREDTHYLLYIYDRMRQDLIDSGNEDKNLLKSVFTRSNQTCLRRYKKPNSDGKDYLRLYSKSHKNFNGRQMYAFENLCQWRDRISRAEDESTGYVLPNHMLLHISEVLPREHQGILACCNPQPPLVKQQLNEIHLIILAAREKPLLNKKIEVEHPSISIIPDIRKVNTESLLHCPHDLSRTPSSAAPTLLATGVNDNLLIKRKQLSEMSTVLIKKEPQITVLKNKSGKVIEQQDFNLTYTTPYERYEMAIENKDGSEHESQEDHEATKSVEKQEDSSEVVDDGIKKDEADNDSMEPKILKKENEDDDDEVQILDICKPLREKVKFPRSRKGKNKKKPTIPLADSQPPAKRGKSKLDDGQTDHSAIEHPNKKQKSEVIGQQTEQRSFKPFDYSQVNYAQGTSSSQGKHFQEHKHSSKMKGGFKSRANQRDGRRMSTFKFQGKQRGRGRGGQNRR